MSAPFMAAEDLRAALRVPLHPVPAEAAAPVITAVAATFGVQPQVLLGHGRTTEVAQARFAAVALVRRRLGYSLPRIGRLLRRHHTTVLHALRRAEALETEDADFAARMARAAATLDGQETG